MILFNGYYDFMQLEAIIHVYSHAETHTQRSTHRQNNITYVSMCVSVRLKMWNMRGNPSTCPQECMKTQICMEIYTEIKYYFISENNYLIIFNVKIFLKIILIKVTLV